MIRTLTPSDNEQPPQGRRSATSTRAILLGFIISIGHIFWLVTQEESWGTGTPSRYALVYTAVFVLFWLVILNLLIKRLRPSLAFAQAELLTIFAMMTVGCALAGVDMVPVLSMLGMEGTHINTEVYPFGKLILPYMPQWLMVTDAETVSTYYKGHSTLLQNGHYRFFIGPFIYWSLFIFCLLMMTFCANTLLRRQWSRNEHLTFPITQLPIALSTEGKKGLLSSPLFWIGFAIAALLTLINGLNFLYPSLPNIPYKNVAYMNLWVQDPWNWMGWTAVTFDPFAIGLAYVIPLDLLFSFWFFTWVWSAERICAKAFTINPSPWPINPGPPHHGAQMIGVWVAILCVVLWTARYHFKYVFQQALHPDTGDPDKREAISYRFALLGVILGFVGILAFLLAMGITWTMVIPYSILLLGIFIILARIRAEFGPMMQDLQGGGPDRAIFSFASPMTVGVRNWSTFNIMTFWMHREAYFTYPSASHIDALKFGEASGGLNRKYWIALLVVGLLGGIIAYWWTLHLGFINGANRYIGKPPSSCYSFCTWRAVFWNFNNETNRPKWDEVGAMSIAFSLTFIIFFIRSRGINLPINPIAYPLTAGNAMRNYWLPIFIAWLIKLIILRYGGLKLYRTMLPFFLGLVVGQFVIGVGWQLLGGALGIKTFAFA